MDGAEETPAMVTTVRAVVGSMAALTLIVCTTRLYLRAFVRKSFGVDDYLVINALIWVLFFCALSIALTFYGIGYHQVDVPPEKLLMMAYLVWVSLSTYLFVAASVKISLVAFIMRIFPGNFIRYYGYGIIVFLAALTISGELLMILQCSPIRAAYDITITDKKCFTQNTLFNIEMYQGVVMFIVDIAIFTMPIPSIWRLQMRLQNRLVLIGLFSLGLVACAASLARLPTLVSYQSENKDFAYAGASSLILMNVEFSLGLISGSLPSLRVLLRSWIRFGSSDKSRIQSHGEWFGGSERPPYPLSEQSWWTQKNMRSPRELESFQGLPGESQDKIVQLPRYNV